MDYETFNKGCLEEAKRLYKTANADQRYVLECLFPELRETEDERIRKAIICGMNTLKEQRKETFASIPINDCIAWLEKQEGCELIRKEWLEHIKQSWYKEGFIDGKYSGGTSKEWAINDTTTLNELIDFLENGTAKLQHDLTKYANWLKVQFTPIEKQNEQKEINLVEILKHYPKETELYSPLYGKLWLAEVDEKNETITCYKHRLEEGCTRAVLEQEDIVSFYSNGTTGLPDCNVSKHCMLFLYDIEKQKVEPKFHEGDWVVTDKNNVVQIKAIEDSKYVLENTMRFSVDYVDKCWHLWTIQDAKNGDVLYSPCCKLLFIFKNDKECHVGNNLNYHAESIVVNSPICVPTDSIPATKEQRDTLMKVMNDAGYTFDFEKKELKKIKQKPVWSEEDEKMLADACIMLDWYKGNNWWKAQHIKDWLKSLKPHNIMNV